MRNYYSRSGKPDSERGVLHRSRVSSHYLLHRAAYNDHLVALVSLSSGIASRLISQKLGRILQSESDRNVIIVKFVISSKPMSFGDWRTLRQGLNGQFGLVHQLQVLGNKISLLDVQTAASPPESRHFRSLLEHCKDHFDYVLVQLDNDLPVAFVLDCLSYVDRSFMLLQATMKDLYLRDLLLREMRVKARSDSLTIKTIVCREKGETHQNDLLRKLGPSVYGFIHGCPTKDVARRIHTWSDRLFHDGIRRLAREICHRRIGLALSSGGARGLSHIGVIQVLEEHGIEVDIIAGCSMGSYVGAIWAYGLCGAVMEELAREVEHRWGLMELLDPYILPRRGFIKGEKIKRRLKRSIGDVHFSELVRPLRIVATNHATLEKVVFSSGEVAQAVHASSAIPGACVPVRIHGQLYMDGGICDPLPVDVLRELGIERIIAVNTIPTPSYLRCGEEMKREHDAIRGKRPQRLSSFFNTYLNYFAAGNILDTIFRSFHGAQIRVAEQSCNEADLVLRPLCWDGRWHDFKHPGKYISIGRKEAEEHLDEIKLLVNGKEQQYENSSIPGTVATV